MIASADFRLEDGTIATVSEGGIVGRGHTAQLRLTAADVSEAHALVSSRQGALHILALRGRLWVNDMAVSESELRVGQRVRLGETTLLLVNAVAQAASGQDATPPTAGESARSVHILLEDGVVRLRSGDRSELVLGGNQAELILLLAAATAPTHWSSLAHHFWPERDRPRWRQRFDALVKELRAKLRSHKIRTDLLWSWDGHHRLNLREGDELTGLPSGDR